MNNKEAVKALLEGRKVRVVNDSDETYLELCFGDKVRINGINDWGRIGELLQPCYQDVEFELFVPPATDEELIAEMERLARQDCSDGHLISGACYSYCAEMLRTRKVNQ